MFLVQNEVALLARIADALLESGAVLRTHGCVTASIERAAMQTQISQFILKSFGIYLKKFRKFSETAFGICFEKFRKFSEHVFLKTLVHAPSRSDPNKPSIHLLRRHLCVIDLKESTLTIGTTNTKTKFLAENDLPSHGRLHDPNAPHTSASDESDINKALMVSGLLRVDALFYGRILFGLIQGFSNWGSGPPRDSWVLTKYVKPYKFKDNPLTQ